MLKTEGLTIRFGGLTAVSDFNLNIGDKEIVGLIGPNGAGKTTVFNMITGVYRPTSGRIWYRDRDITGWKPHALAAAGICRTFQNIRLFRDMTVFENVLVGCHLEISSDVFSSTFRLPGYRKREAEAEEKAHQLLKMVELSGVEDEPATALPYGQQRRLEIVRALATRPSILLLDEPAAGMNPQESLELMEFIRRLRDELNLSIFLIEHHMQVVMGVCDRMYVLDYGQTIAQGRPSEIQKNQKVIDAYLGVQ